MTMLCRVRALNLVAETASFLSSDLATVITDTIANVTCGMVSG